MTTTHATTTARHRLTALHADRLFDGVSGAAVEDAMIVFDGPSITAVDRRAQFTNADDMAVRDLPGATLMPGLIDTHVHLCFDASRKPVDTLADRDDDAAVAAMAGAAKTALTGGITTVRDLGDREYLSLRLRGRPDLPTIVAAGPPITTINGHCHFLGGSTAGADGMQRPVHGAVHPA